MAINMHLSAKREKVPVKIAALSSLRQVRQGRRYRIVVAATWIAHEETTSGT